MNKLTKKLFNHLRSIPSEGEYNFSGSTLLSVIRNTQNPLMHNISASIDKVEKEKNFTALELVHFEFTIHFRKNN